MENFFSLLHRGTTQLLLAGAFLLVGHGVASAACSWQSSIPVLANSREGLYCSPDAFRYGCIIVINDSCKSKYGCRDIYFDTNVTVGIRRTHKLAAWETKKICYGQVVTIDSCRPQVNLYPKSCTSKRYKCYDVLSRVTDNGYGGSGPPCSGSCHDGMCDLNAGEWVDTDTCG